MDGVDDVIEVNHELPFCEVVIEAVFLESPSGGGIHHFWGGNSHGWAFYSNEDGYVSSGTEIYWNEVELSDGSFSGEIPLGERVIYTAGRNYDLIIPYTDFFYCNRVGQRHGRAEVFDVKVFNREGGIELHYDMTTGTVLDQSGNGRHGTLIGGTWMGKEEPLPEVSINNVTRDIISNQPGMDTSIVSFSFDQEITQWTVNVGGNSPETGIIANYGGETPKGTQITAEIDWTKLPQEGENRVNIYGQNPQGAWTSYDSP